MNGATRRNPDGHNFVKCFDAYLLNVLEINILLPTNISPSSLSCQFRFVLELFVYKVKSEQENTQGRVKIPNQT